MATGDITHLLMHMFGGSKDEYGKDVVPPYPLLFDRVNEGRLPLSKSALFKLPLEILGMVLQVGLFRAMIPYLSKFALELLVIETSCNSTFIPSWQC